MSVVSRQLPTFAASRGLSAACSRRRRSLGVVAGLGPCPICKRREADHDDDEQYDDDPHLWVRPHCADCCGPALVDALERKRRDFPQALP